MTAPHAALRAATAEAHERVHQLPQFVGLTGGKLDRAKYGDLLTKLLGFHAPYEYAIAAKLGDTAYGLPLARLRRAALLEDDLRVLGLSKAHVLRVPVRSFPTKSQAMGALYVIEGATLGGRQLAQGLDPLLGEGVTAGRRFLLAGTDPARPTWREVRAAIDRCARNRRALARMMDGATATFKDFARMFEEPEWILR